MMSASDCEPLALSELLSMADPQARAAWEGLMLGYTESTGHPLLRREIAGLYATVAPEEVLVAAPEEAIFLAMNALLSPGDEVVATWPGYQSLYEVAAAIGCHVLYWAPVESNAGWHFEVETLRRLVSPRTRMVVINFPHNPTGALPGADEFAAVLAIAEESGAWRLSDEMYRGLEYARADRLPAAADCCPKALSLGGVSKGLALPGLRIGWLAGHDAATLAEVATLKDYTTICSAAPSEWLAIMALRAREEILARNRAIIAANVERAQALCAAHPAVLRWRPPRAGSVAFVAWAGPEPTATLCADLVATEGVVALPAEVYGYGRGHLRVGLGRRALPEALAGCHRHLCALGQ
jgi:aspartate/methionine/tyrosine aminotransferase